MVRWLYINAIGGVTISASTLVAASYLFVSLWRQGRGKLRVRLLQGMVISDILLGLVAIVPESIYLSDLIGLKTGSGGCNAAAFLLTVVLFTQHLWTLAIAYATFLLLKHPLSHATSIMERYSIYSWPIIWAISLIHSGLWWRFVGWSSSGNLCYYGSHPITSAKDLDARDLVQFIPRAFVFIVIVGLYSTLFQFLRRPDTIQLSSQFVSGGVTTDHGDTQMGKMFRKFGSRADPTPKRHEPVDPDAPWEQLEFVQVGHTKPWDTPPLGMSTLPESSKGLLESRPESPTRGNSDYSTHFPTSLARGSTSSGEGTYTMASSQRPSQVDTLVTPDRPIELAHYSSSKTQVLSPVHSTMSKFDTESLNLDLEVEDHPRMAASRRSSGQGLKEFFQENRATGLEDAHTRTGTNGEFKMSATAYFNRQASLLMLYFPLAYMVVFSISLIRLIYAMVHKQPSPVLTLMSSWMVLSVGLIDGLVYGLAEFLVRRRVRRKMPDRLTG